MFTAINHELLNAQVFVDSFSILTFAFESMFLDFPIFRYAKNALDMFQALIDIYLKTESCFPYGLEQITTKAKHCKPNLTLGDCDLFLCNRVLQHLVHLRHPRHTLQMWVHKALRFPLAVVWRIWGSRPILFIQPI